MKIYQIILLAIVINCITIIIPAMIKYIFDTIKKKMIKIIQCLYLNENRNNIIEERLNEIENNIMTEMACLAAKIDGDIKNIKYEPSVETVDKIKEYSIDQLIEENKHLKEENKILKQKYSDVCKKYLKITYPHLYGMDINSLKW